MAQPLAAITIFNTLTRKKEILVPLYQGKISFYSCGPTVYHFAHIGNLRTYIFNDILKRAFTYLGYEVNHVMNITDVGHLTSDADEGEDKMEKGARREGKSVWQIATFYTEAFQRDLRALNILPPNIWCKATDHIREQIEQIQAIEQAGYAYTISDGVYFDTAKMPDYGSFARLDLESLKAGARVEVAAGKRNPTDFALWKFSPAHSQRQMEWDSPWGKGFPGWHIECSAMAVKYLGPQFDLHTGGIDHVPVHHTNEIAQAHAAGLPFSKYWMHGEFLVVKEGEKMAKSNDNFLTVSALIERGFLALDYRYLCLSAHYRKQLTFSWESMQGAADAYRSLRNKIFEARNSAGAENPILRARYQEQFAAALCDDCNMPQALAVLWDALGDAQLAGSDKYLLAMQFDDVLGLQLNLVGSEAIPEDVRDFVAEREAARERKDWKTSDALREKISLLGFEVRDTPEGPVVRPK